MLSTILPPGDLLLQEIDDVYYIFYIWTFLSSPASIGTWDTPKKYKRRVFLPLLGDYIFIPALFLRSNVHISTVPIEMPTITGLWALHRPEGKPSWCPGPVLRISCMNFVSIGERVSSYSVRQAMLYVLLRL